MALYPVILAGGSGSRLWPLSREYYPKPFLTVAGERSMLQETIARLDGIEDVSAPIIVCNEEHRFLAAEHARQIGTVVSSIILEPVGRNTAPALTLAALALADGRWGSGAPVVLVLPADHVIRDVATFQSTVTRGVALAEGGCLVTFGIVPSAPETAYGYIKRGRPFELPDEPSDGKGGRGVDDELPRPVPFALEAFVEKPDEATAARLVESKDYLWNSGMFMMRVSVWLEQLELHRPDIAEVCRAAYSGGHTDGDFYRPDADIFATCPTDTIDYAVMEQVAGGSPRDNAAPISPAGLDGASVASPQCVVFPLDAGWSDVGTWSALWEEGTQDAQGNVLQGDVYADSMRNSLLIGQHRLLAAVGLDDVIAVETADAVLVVHRDRVQDVKALVARLKHERRPEQENHRKVHRPWGSYETVDMGPRFQVKRLTVNPGAALSLQTHSHRAEHWVVVRGTAKVTRGDEEFLLTENQSTFVPVGTRHRLENPTEAALEIIEVQSGSYLGEDDIVRVDDHYNRHKERPA